MTDTKVTIDDAVKHITSTLSQHADALRRLQDTVTSLQPQLDTRLTDLRSNTHQEMSLMETNLTALITSKDNMWTQASIEMRDLNHGLVEVKNLLISQRPAASSVPDPTLPSRPSRPLDSSPNNQSPPPLHFTNSVPYSSPRQTSPSRHTIVLPPPSSVPSFSGKLTDRPRQFLIRVKEYTTTVTHWSSDTLLRGISQFLRDDAFEWYCQLHQTNDVPQDWDEFVVRFLAQFHSPLRAAQQEQAWMECTQTDNETINQFVVRLRSLWLDQKPDEKESDFTKHLFCKMRPDMLNLMNFSRSSSLEHIILEAQKVEEILYLRAKEQRQRDLHKQKHGFSTSDSAPSALSPSSSSTSHSQSLPSLMSLPHRNRGTTSPSSNSPRPSTKPSRATVTCWRCYELGHYASACPLNETSPSQMATFTNSSEYQPFQSRPTPSSQALPPRSKNK